MSGDSLLPVSLMAFLKPRANETVRYAGYYVPKVFYNFGPKYAYQTRTDLHVRENSVQPGKEKLEMKANHFKFPFRFSYSMNRT